jgi:tripartite-type tricarboxylate transporter receptor subunit TctC
MTAAACGSGGGEGDASANAEGTCYEEGDEVELVVPFEQGGGTDTTARLFAPFLAEQMGIDIQVVNVPGAGSVLGANRYVTQTEANGDSWLLTSASTHVPPIVQQQGVEFGFDDLTPVAGFPLGGVIYAKPDGPLAEPSGLVGENQSEQITYAGQPASGGELRILLIFEMFNTDVNAVLGYDGRGPARIAFEQGESDVSYDTTPAYIESVEPLVEAGTAEPLMSFGWPEDGELVRDPQLEDLPSPAEVYEEATGEPLEGEAMDAYLTMSAATISLNKALTIHADAPENCVEELRAAWDELGENQEFLDAAEAELGGYEVLVRDDVQSAWDAMAGVEQSSIEWLLQWVEETYDVRLQEAQDD